MLLFMLFLISLRLLFIAVDGKVGYGSGEQDWGYVDIREGAHMFYWLHYTTATSNYTEHPLVIWLQGGPGESSTGIGNFKEIGPLDCNGNERDYSWVKDVNVLFIDSPVGSGFSYVDDEELLTTTYQQIAKDLVIFMKAFYKKYPNFKDVPLHIFGESYGGKVAAQFALELYYALQKKELYCNLTSVVLVSPAISTEDEIMTYAPLLLYLGVVDYDGYNEILEAANEIKKLLAAEKWNQAFDQWIEVFELIECIDTYNIIGPSNCTQKSDDDILKNLMQGPVSKNLSISSDIKWCYQYHSVYKSLTTDGMMPAIHVVSELLDKTNLRIGVVSGQLDFMVSTVATVNWINKMEWSFKSEYLAAPRNAINISGIIEGHEKITERFSLFSIYRTGHMIAADNPKAMKYILHKFISHD